MSISKMNEQNSAGIGSAPTDTNVTGVNPKIGSKANLLLIDNDGIPVTDIEHLRARLKGVGEYAEDMKRKQTELMTKLKTLKEQN